MRRTTIDMHDEREHLGAGHGGPADAHRTAPDGTGGRLGRLVERAVAHRCIVLSAPPGYGKTVTAGAIAARTAGPVLWCRLTDADVGDGGASRVLDALVEAYPHLGHQPPVADSTGAATGQAICSWASSGVTACSAAGLYVVLHR